MVDNAYYCYTVTTVKEMSKICWPITNHVFHLNELCIWKVSNMFIPSYTQCLKCVCVCVCVCVGGGGGVNLVECF
jgi:hypothetical protein